MVMQAPELVPELGLWKTVVAHEFEGGGSFQFVTFSAAKPSMDDFAIECKVRLYVYYYWVTDREMGNLFVAMPAR